MSTFLFAISKHSPVIRATVEDDTSNLSAEKLTYYREGRRRPGEKKWTAWLILFRGEPSRPEWTKVEEELKRGASLTG
ncbi:hypothetical protein F9856_10735 [Streptococcus suis]|uniref:hypothetical protein n=1 Tax=Streptococcus suis TaxID=1307 RepID=UPI001924269E|nr:hypothetical protein [Streptococcus suis]MBL1126589.1 hypothetical protein [Streptococcus suis]